MRILLVTFSGLLESAITQILNPANTYRAIVVDDVESAREFLTQFGYPAEKIFAFYELPECAENLHFDIALCVGLTLLVDEVRRCGVPKNKIVHLAVPSTVDNFLLDRALRYYKKNFARFEMFATGMSYIELGLIPKLFTKKLFNFARSGQDLYAIALQDVHNFFLSAEEYRSIFREEYLNYHLPIDDIEIDSVTPPGDYSRQNFDAFKKLAARKRIDVWKDRNFPDTRAENLKILDEYLTLCEENKIAPIIFLPTVSEGYKKHFSRQKLDE